MGKMKKTKRPTLPASPPLTAQPAPAPQRGPALAPETRASLPPAISFDDDQDEPPMEPPEEQAAKRKAAIHAKHTFAGHALRPLSISRERLLLDIRSAAGAGAFGRMDSLFGDALRFVWLCLHDGDHLEAMEGGIGLPGSTSQPITVRFQLAIDRWSDRNAALIRQHRDAMVDTFISAWGDNQRTQVVPESTHDDDSGN